MAPLRIVNGTLGYRDTPVRNYCTRLWRMQKIFMGVFIQWRMVSFVFGVRCL